MPTGLWAIIYKEMIQVRRDPATKLIFVIPAIQLIVFGFAVDTDIRQIPTAVFNSDRRTASREFLSKFQTTDVFQIVEETPDAAAVRDAIVAGRAKVGIILPPRFSDDLLNGRTAQVQLLIDGSDNTAATQALNVANGIVQDMSVARRPGDRRVLQPVSLRPKVLFNENVESDHFFVPGLIGIILQLTTVFLTSFSIVRERERGTMEQLMVTPVSRWALILGKLIPFAIIGVIETCVVLLLMVYAFGIPISGSKLLLMSLSVLFLLPSLGLGILISTAATNQAQATQMSLLILLPSVILSGFMFSRANMPWPIYAVSSILPVTYYIEILRGIILRGAEMRHLWYPTAVLALLSALILIVSAFRFQKRIE